MKRIISILLTLVMLVSIVAPAGVITVSSATASRYSVLVLDVSGSETFTSGFVQIYQAETAVEYVKTSAMGFLEDIVNASGENYVAVVTYDSEATIVSDFTNDIEALKTKVDSITDSGDKDRNIAGGLAKAQSLIESIPNTGATKNVILFTTGMTDSGEHNYDGFYDKSVTGSQWYNSGTGIYLYGYANVAYSTAFALREQATIYTLGLFQTLEQIPEKGKDIAEFFRMTARDLASSPEFFYDASNPQELEFAFDEIADDINATPGKFKYAGSFDDKTDAEAEYWYSDNYFFKRSSLYSASLATMSLCLELSCWSSHEKKDWYNSNDPNSLNDKLVNAKTLLMGNPKAGEGYGGIGFTDFDANEYWKAAPTNDSIGVCLARKKISKNNKDYTLIAVVIRGGGYGSEWASNFKVGAEGDHEGFTKARKDVTDFLKKYIEKLSSAEKENIKLWIVGYSRAGATANMTAGFLNENPQYLGATIGEENIYCYTFEAPQGVLTENMSGSYRNVHNVVNANDIVPLVAPSSWGFARYNYQNARFLPTLYTTDSKVFAKQLEAMKTELKKLASGYTYGLNEQFKLQIFKVDKTKFLPGGDPLWWYEETTLSTQTIIDKAIDILAEDLIMGRENYVESFQYTISKAVGIIMHYDGVGAGAKNYAKELFDLDAFTKKLKELFTIDSIRYIISPIFKLDLTYSLDERLEDVKKRLLKKVGTIFEAYAEITGLIDALGEGFSNLFVSMAKDAWNNNTDSINYISAFITMLILNGFDAHYPEICLAWCRSLDAHYNINLLEDKNCAITRIVKIGGAADVYVYDEEGEIIAKIEDDKPAEDNDISSGVNENGEKTVYVPGGGDYTVEVKPTDDGEVNVSVNEYSFAHSETVRVDNYYDIGVAEGDKLIASLPSPSLSDLKENSIKGTSAKYELTLNDYNLYCSESFTGERTADKIAKVTVQTEGNGGYATGTGNFLPGCMARVEAFTLPNGSFLGWFDDAGNPVSEQKELAFVVKENTSLTAKFSDVALYKIKVVQSSGGHIEDSTGVYPEAAEIQLKATAEDGYEFVRWEIVGGTVDNLESAEATMIMPNSNVTIKAVFERSNGFLHLLIIILIVIAGLAVAVFGVVIAIFFIKKKKSNTPTPPTYPYQQ